MDVVVAVGAVTLLATLCVMASWHRGQQRPQRDALRDVAFVFWVLLWVSTAASLIGFRLQSGQWTDLPEDGLFVAAMGSALGGGVASLCAVLRHGAERLGLTRLGSLRWWLRSLGLGIAFLVFSALWGMVQEWALGPQTPQELLRFIDAQWPDLPSLLVVVYAVVGAPVIEEIIFRGSILQALSRRWGMWAGIALSATLFGLMHISDPIAVPPLIVLGVLLAWVRIRSDALWPAIALHVSNNLLAVGLMVFFSGEMVLDSESAALVWSAWHGMG